MRQYSDELASAMETVFEEEYSGPPVRVALVSVQLTTTPMIERRLFTEAAFAALQVT